MATAVSAPRAVRRRVASHVPPRSIPRAKRTAVDCSVVSIMARLYPNFAARASMNARAVILDAPGRCAPPLSARLIGCAALRAVCAPDRRCAAPRGRHVAAHVKALADKAASGGRIHVRPRAVLRGRRRWLSRCAVRGSGRRVRLRAGCLRKEEPHSQRHHGADFAPSVTYRLHDCTRVRAAPKDVAKLIIGQAQRVLDFRELATRDFKKH